jgi:phage baseplate assembly protein W
MSSVSRFKFKSSGQNTSDLRKEADNLLQIKKQKEIPIGIKTPIKLSGRDNQLFKMNLNMIDQMNDNLRNLIMTEPGERLGFPSYGTRLKTLTKSPDNENLIDEVMEQITNTVSIYMPFISLKGFNSTVDRNNYTIGPVLNIDIKYSIPQLSNEDINLNIKLLINN